MGTLAPICAMRVNRSIATDCPSFIAKVRAAKTFRAANACLRQLAFAKIDMVIHGGEPCDPDQVKKVIHWGDDQEQEAPKLEEVPKAAEG